MTSHLRKDFNREVKKLNNPNKNKSNVGERLFRENFKKYVKIFRDVKNTLHLLHENGMPGKGEAQHKGPVKWTRQRGKELENEAKEISQSAEPKAKEMQDERKDKD